MTTSYESTREIPGGRIGPYKLLGILGEGGYGIVYLAEQQEPIKRRVALKIIKPGMDTKQVIARFEAERQALAFFNIDFGVAKAVSRPEKNANFLKLQLTFWA